MSPAAPAPTIYLPKLVSTNMVLQAEAPSLFGWTSGDAGPDSASLADGGVDSTPDVSDEDGPAPVEDAPVQPPDVAAN